VSGLVSPPIDARIEPGALPTALPFRIELSLAPLIRFWTQLSAYSEFGRGPLPGIIREKVKQAPELSAVIDDVSVIGQHQWLVDLMMSAMFPPAFWEQEYGAALFPFQLRAFYATSAFRRTLMNDDGTLHGRVNADEQRLRTAKVLLAYGLILERTYGIDLGVEIPVVFTSEDPDTMLERHFRLDFDWRFVDVKFDGPAPKLTDAMRRQLQSGNVDLDLLRDLLPPEKVTLRGFMTLKAVDVTDQEVLSSLKRDLIDKESIVSKARFESLQAKLRTLFRRPGLHLGLAATEGDRVLVLNDAMSHDHASIFGDWMHHKTSEFKGSLYERAVVQDRPVMIDDLTAWPDRTQWEDELVARGARTFVCAPLHYQDRVIGTFELISTRPGDLNATHLPKLEEVLPLFSMAVQRSVEELDTRVQAIIKEKCTAIHPVVEWRFRKAVLKGIENQAEGTDDAVVELEPIVFERVYPLYALSDIRGSSTQRSLAIQTDLLTQLRLARDVIRWAHDMRPLPGLHQLLYRLDKQTAKIQANLNSGDEVSTIAFLRADVEALFDHLQTFGPGVRERIETYRAALDPRIGTVYDRRRLFEDSVTRIADGISSYLDLEEQTAQTMFPHYFEKQKTDGVDHQIYVGASLLEDGRFDPLYLKSLRLWQLMVTCGVALRVNRLKDKLSVPLEVTHLVLVQHSPLGIRFRFDEKRFDVDGAYDIRYEIVKKRIDKAVIKRTEERVTQPGKIAIVYAHPSEAHEYRGYIEYLQSLGYFTGEVEDVELDELQGVHGLRALRVAIDLRNPRVDRRVALADLQPATGASSRN
jgi:GAF domain